jgi:acyl carrier protein
MQITSTELREIIEEADTMVEMDELNNSDSLVEQGVDSLDMANIFLMLEEKYEIEIPDEDIPQLQTIDNIVKYIEAK